MMMMMTRIHNSTVQKMSQGGGRWHIVFSAEGLEFEVTPLNSYPGSTFTHTFVNFRTGFFEQEKDGDLLYVRLQRSKFTGVINNCWLPAHNGQTGTVAW